MHKIIINTTNLVASLFFSYFVAMHGLGYYFHNENIVINTLLGIALVSFWVYKLEEYQDKVWLIQKIRSEN